MVKSQGSAGPDPSRTATSETARLGSQASANRATLARHLRDQGRTGVTYGNCATPAPGTPISGAAGPPKGQGAAAPAPVLLLLPVMRTVHRNERGRRSG